MEPLGLSSAQVNVSRLTGHEWNSDLYYDSMKLNVRLYLITFGDGS
jgi:hypothetical protein